MMAILALTASAYDFMVDGIAYNYLNDSNGNEVGVAYGSGSNINIPSQVTYNGKTYTVTRICDQAFWERNITSITIPSSITSIGNMAFSDCGVGAVYITDIAKWCEITFEGFRLSEAMGDIEEISNPLYQAHHLYLNGVEVKDLVIPNTVTRITSYAFLGCSSFTSVTIPSSVTSIGYGAFGLCDNIQSVHISDLAKWCEINFVDPYFDDWYGHGFSVLYSNPLRVAHHLYINGEEIKNLIIPNTVTKINDYAFEGASSITSVTIPNSVKYLGDKSLSCSGLTEINSKIQDVSTVDTWDESYGRTKDVFESVPKTTCVLKVPAGTANSYRQTAPWSDFTNIVEVADELDDEFIVNGIAYKKNDNGNTVSVISNIVNNVNYPNLTVANIPASITVNGTTYAVTSIGNKAFYQCSGLTSVTIPNSVTSIGGVAFYGCSGLTRVNISDIAKWCNIDFETLDANPLFYAHNLYLNSEEVKSLSIPSSVTTIGNNTFFGCSGLTSVTIGNSVTSIGDQAFAGCIGLTSLTIGDSVTSIGFGAFFGCSKLTSLIIGNSVTSIGFSAFYGCSKLASVTIPNSVTSIDECAFEGCSGLTEIRSKITDVSNVTMGSNVYRNVPTSSCTLKVPVGTSAAYRNANQWKAFNNINGVILMPSGTVGDLNCDNVVDGTDLNIMTNQLIHTTDYIDDDGATDINGDGRTSGFDINNMISIILGQ